MEKKKKIVLYGNCHVEYIERLLLSIKAFTNQYEILHILPIHMIKDSTYFERDEFKECDYFIHQSIRLGNRYGDEYSSERIFERLKSNCTKIAIPNMYHLPICLFPQYNEKKEFKNWKGATLFFRDSIIDDLYEKKYSCGKIIRNYMNYSFEENTEIEYQKFIEKVKKREKEWDIVVSDFIESNYKNQLLFFDPNHPTKELLDYITEELLKILNVDYGKKFDSGQVDEVFNFQMPIIQEVRDNLGMELNDDILILRRNGAKIYPGEWAGISQYVKQYVAMEWQNDELCFTLRFKSFLRYVIYFGKYLIKKVIEKIFKK